MCSRREVESLAEAMERWQPERGNSNDNCYTRNDGYDSTNGDANSSNNCCNDSDDETCNSYSGNDSYDSKARSERNGNDSSGNGNSASSNMGKTSNGKSSGTARFIIVDVNTVSTAPETDDDISCDGLDEPGNDHSEVVWEANPPLHIGILVHQG
jgi:hypothetical protein